MRIPRALTVAGSDSGGGAGIQADLKTFHAAGVFGMSVITALTAQNTRGVFGVYPVPPDFIARQFDAVVEDIGVDALKTGMLATAEVIETVADRIRHHGIERVVVDPVMVAKSGDPLLDPSARDALRERLLPLALVATPNLPEAEALLGRRLASLADMEEAARDLHHLGVRYPLVKGGHLADEEAADVFYDGRRVHVLREPRIPTPHTHGTGCTLSAAIAAALARGAEPLEAVRFGKRFVTEAIARALPVGRGRGPTNPGGLVRPLDGPREG